jgi:hypothetical protein
MFVWELVSCRLQDEGWNVWHTTSQDSYGPIYRVHFERSELAYEVSGPTLTEAYAAAARRARDHQRPASRAGALRTMLAGAAGPMLLGI